jgi:hypothetical protein
LSKHTSILNDEKYIFCIRNMTKHFVKLHSKSENIVTCFIEESNIYLKSHNWFELFQLTYSLEVIVKKFAEK